MEHPPRLTACLTPDIEAGGFVVEALELGVVSRGEAQREALAALDEAVDLLLEES